MGVERNMTERSLEEKPDEAKDEVSSAEGRIGKRSGVLVPGYMKPTVVSTRKAWYVADRLNKMSSLENSLPSNGRVMTARRQASSLSFQTMDDLLPEEKRRDSAEFQHFNTDHALLTQRLSDPNTQSKQHDLSNTLYGRGYGSRKLDREPTASNNNKNQFLSGNGSADGGMIGLPIKNSGNFLNRPIQERVRQNRSALGHRQLYFTHPPEQRTNSNSDLLQNNQTMSVSSNNFHTGKIAENQHQNMPANSPVHLPDAMASSYNRLSRHDTGYSPRRKVGNGKINESENIIEETILLSGRSGRPLSVNSRTTADSTRLLSSRHNQRIGLDLNPDTKITKTHWQEEAATSIGTREHPGLSVIALPVHQRCAWNEGSKERELGKIIHVNDEEFKRLPVHERLLLRGKSAERSKDLQYFLRTANGIVRLRNYNAPEENDHRRLNSSYGAQKRYQLRRANTELSPINRNSRLKTLSRVSNIKTEKCKKEKQNSNLRLNTDGEKYHGAIDSDSSKNSEANNDKLTVESEANVQRSGAANSHFYSRTDQEKTPKDSYIENGTTTCEHPIKTNTNSQSNQNILSRSRTQVTSGCHFRTRNVNSSNVNKEGASDVDTEERTCPEENDAKSDWILKWLEDMSDLELERPASPLINDDEPPQTDTAIHIVYTEN